jgi:hypothetical protein
VRSKEEEGDAYGTEGSNELSDVIDDPPDLARSISSSSLSSRIIRALLSAHSMSVSSDMNEARKMGEIDVRVFVDDRLGDDLLSLIGVTGNRWKD